MSEATLLFEEYPKIPRLKREVVITEKIDGTNAQIGIIEINSPEILDRVKADPWCIAHIPGAINGDMSLAIYAGSRSRWLKPEKSQDNFGFAKWVVENQTELAKLGPGRHFGEWYGAGIQRNYGLDHKRFALFNVARWNPENPNRPACCEVVPTLARGEGIDDNEVMEELFKGGSCAVPGFMQPEGIVVFHSASRQLYKRTFEQDGGKWKVA